MKSLLPIKIEERLIAFKLSVIVLCAFQFSRDAKVFPAHTKSRIEKLSRMEAKPKVQEGRAALLRKCKPSKHPRKRKVSRLIPKAHEPLKIFKRLIDRQVLNYFSLT